MSYPFKKVEHCVYKNTFLKDVRVAVRFPFVNPQSVNREVLTEFFEFFNGATIDVEVFLNNQRISIFSDDHCIEFKFGLDYAEAKISAQKYTSFENAKPYWDVLYNYLHALQLSSVEKLIVRKYNALYFKASDEKYDVKSVMAEVFSGHLMSFMTEINQEDSLNSIEKSLSIPDVESDSLFNVVFGIKKSDTATSNDHLTLVLTLESNKAPILLREFYERMDTYNSVLFNAFHWCINDSIIQFIR